MDVLDFDGMFSSRSPAMFLKFNCKTSFTLEDGVEYDFLNFNV